MIAIKGIYQDGRIQLERKIHARKPISVIVTFLDEEIEVVGPRLSLDDFSFKQAREKAKSFKGSLSEVVIDERKRER